MTEPTIENKSAPRKISGLYIFAALILVMIFASYRSAVPSIECTAEVLATNPDVIMLGTAWCPYCAQARKYFHANKVHYCEYDIERSKEGARRYTELDGGAIPILIVDEKKYTGFDPVAFERLMANKK